MKAKRFKLPKHKKGREVTTPDGRGVISSMKYDRGKSWYEVGGRWYSENELHP